MDSSPLSPVNIALFIDIENLIGGATSQGLPIDVDPIVRRLRQQGRVLIRRSYGDIHNSASGIGGASSRVEENIRRMLGRNLVQVEDIPYLTSSKNTADIRLVVDALSEAFRNDAITHFAVVSSDRDYIPLYNKLRELNKTIVAIVVDRLNVNSMVLEAADKVEYYETLFAPVPSLHKVAAVEEDAFGKADLERLRREYFDLLRDAVRAIESQQGKPVGARVFPMMTQLRSDFDPQNLQISSFKNFVQMAEKAGEVTVDWGDGKGDFVIGASHKLHAPARSTPALSVTQIGDTKKIVKAYRRFLEDKLKLGPDTFPDKSVRQEILAQANLSRDRLQRDGPFRLEDWKLDIQQNLPANMRDERVIFKLLLSLRYSRCLQLSHTSQDGPVEVVGVSIEPARWDQAIVHNFCRQIKYEGAWGSSPDPAALAELFYPGETDGKARIQTMLAES